MKACKICEFCNISPSAGKCDITLISDTDGPLSIADAELFIKAVLSVNNAMGTHAQPGAAVTSVCEAVVLSGQDFSEFIASAGVGAIWPSVAPQAGSASSGQLHPQDDAVRSPSPLRPCRGSVLAPLLPCTLLTPARQALTDKRAM